MSWPPVWEENFVATSIAHKQRVDTEVLNLPAASELSPEQKDTICWVLLTVDVWASELDRDLRKCPWTPLDQLREPMPPLKTDRERKKWNHYRKLLDGRDACWATRDAIAAGDWIDAIQWAMMAGNRLLLDQAATGRARGAAKSSPNKRTAHADYIARRNEFIVRKAEDMMRRNPNLTENDVAKQLAGEPFEQKTLPGAERIRQIVRDARNLGTFDAPSQV